MKIWNQVILSLSLFILLSLLFFYCDLLVLKDDGVPVFKLLTVQIVKFYYKYIRFLQLFRQGLVSQFFIQSAECCSTQLYCISKAFRRIGLMANDLMSSQIFKYEQNCKRGTHRLFVKQMFLFAFITDHLTLNVLKAKWKCQVEISNCAQNARFWSTRSVLHLRDESLSPNVTFLQICVLNIFKPFLRITS